MLPCDTIKKRRALSIGQIKMYYIHILRPWLESMSIPFDCAEIYIDRKKHLKDKIQRLTKMKLKIILKQRKN